MRADRRTFGLLAAMAAAMGVDFGADRIPNARHQHSVYVKSRGRQIRTGKNRAYRKRKRAWEATRRELWAKGENLGGQALHNERRRGAGHWRRFSRATA